MHLQPRLHAPVDSLPTLLVIVTFPVTYLKVALPRLPPLQSTVVAPQTKHLEDVQRARMASEALPFVVPLPDCPRVQAAFCAGLLHPEGADRVIPLPSVKYGLEVVLPTLPEIPQSQASLGALLQPAKHPLLPDSQYLWQVTLVQQKEFGSYEAHQASRAIIPLTEVKANPPHSALQTDYACSRLSPDELRLIYVEGRPVKATNRGQPWKEAEQRTSTDFFQRIHHYFNEIGASTRIRQESAEYPAGKQAKKQEKLAHTVVSQPCLTRTAQSSCFITVDKIRFSKKCQATRCLFGQQLFAFSLLTNRFWFQKRSWCGPRFGHRFWYHFWAPHCFFAQKRDRK